MIPTPRDTARRITYVVQMLSGQEFAKARNFNPSQTVRVIALHDCGKHTQKTSVLREDLPVLQVNHCIFICS